MSDRRLTFLDVEEANIPEWLAKKSEPDLPSWATMWWENREHMAGRARGAIGLFLPHEEPTFQLSVIALLKKLLQAGGPRPDHLDGKQLAYFVNVNKDDMMEVRRRHLDYAYLGLVGISMKYGDNWVEQIVRARWAEGAVTFLILPVGHPSMETAMTFMGLT